MRVCMHSHTHTQIYSAWESGSGDSPGFTAFTGQTTSFKTDGLGFPMRWMHKALGLTQRSLTLNP